MNPKTLPNMNFINTNKKSKNIMTVKGGKLIMTHKYWIK